MELHEVEKAYTSLAEKLPYAFFDLNFKGRFIYINRVGMALLGREEGLLGHKFAEKVPRRHLYKLLKIFNDAAKKGWQIGNIDLKVKGGEQSVTMEVRAVKAEKKVTGFQCFVREGGKDSYSLTPFDDELITSLLTARIVLDNALREEVRN